MNTKAHLYRPLVFPPKKYANFHLSRELNVSFSNVNYQELLMFIGKHRYHTEVLRTICRKIKEEYNKEYSFNRKRHIKKRMSANQIESLAYSFDNFFVKEDVIIRIPFATVPILFFILTIYKDIEDRNEDIRNKINSSNIGACLCARQIETMQIHLHKMLSSMPKDDEYRLRCNALNDDLVLHPTFVSMNWEAFRQNRTDFVKTYWGME